MKFNPVRRGRPADSKHHKPKLQSLETRKRLVGVEIFASDVNGNGQVAPGDVLQVINALHSQRKGSVL